MMRGILGTCCWFNFFNIIEKTIQSGVNPSVVVSLATITSFTTAIVFYFIFQEKLQFRHLIGMVLATASVILIAYSEESQLQNDGRLSVFVPIAYESIQIVFYTTNLVITRFALRNQNNSNLKYISSYLCIYGISPCIGFWYTVIYKEGYTSSDIAPMILASFLMILGHICMNEATKYGKVGITQAIQQTQCIVQLILEVVVLNRVPKQMELGAIGLAIVGAMIISIGSSGNGSGNNSKNKE